MMTKEKFVKKKRRETQRLWREGFLNAAGRELIEELLTYIMDERSVTEEDVFNFYNNLMTIRFDMNKEGEDSSKREMDYIITWLRSKGLSVV